MGALEQQGVSAAKVIPFSEKYNMVVKRLTKPTKPKLSRPKNWREAVRRYLSKVPEIDAVYVSTASRTIHVYSVVEDFHSTDYERLIRQEDRIEKAYPRLSFEFHTRVHRGRKPNGDERYGSELVFLR